MGSVFRKTVTKPLPTGADIVEKGGRRYARWKCKGKNRTAPLTEGRDGIVQVVPTGCRDEAAARHVLSELERQAELVRSGVMSRAEALIGRHRETSLETHFAAFDEHLRAKGVTKIHREDTGRYLRRLAADCSFGNLSDLKREVLERWLAERA